MPDADGRAADPCKLKNLPGIQIPYGLERLFAGIAKMVFNP